MATTSHKAYTQSAATALSTELNSLANGSSSSASSAIDNTSNLDLFMDVELLIAAQGSSRSAGAVVEIYMTTSLDGTNYDDATRGVSELVAIIPLDAATTARRRTVRSIDIPPANFKLFAYNGTGQAFAASGSTVRYRTHSITTA